jgi:hypothetical protein
MQRYNFAGTPTIDWGAPAPGLRPYANGGNTAASSRAVATASAPMYRPLVKPPPRPRPSTDDEESESDENGYRRDSNIVASPNARSTASASLNRPYINSQSTNRSPPADEESESDENEDESDDNESESDDEATIQRNSTKTSTRSGPVGPPVCKYPDRPLDRSKFETRFLSILPGQSTEVSCTLTIDSLLRAPVYVALSYHWGDQSSTRSISLGGSRRGVTASLEAALQELRSKSIQVIWVDALCIYQPDIYEKAYQLGQMSNIFSKAVKVIAWLGPAADDSSNAMQVLASMQFSSRYNASIAQLLRRPYWKRAWIIQELAKASKVEIWCGAQMLPWEVFIRGVLRWWYYMKIRVGDFDDPIMALQFFRNAEADVRKGAARMLLSAAMVRSLHTKATLDKDKIYALLGLTRDGTETVPTPNYFQDDATVFDTVLKHMIIAQGQLTLIFLAGVKRARGIPPSWLPRWNDLPLLQSTPWLVRCFEHVRTTNNVVECHNDTLKVTGQILGRLQANTDTPRTAVSAAQAADLLRATAWQLLKCRWNDHHLHTVPSEYDLAAIWAPSKLPVSANFPKLRQFYVSHANICFAGITLQASVAALSTHPQTLRAAQLILTSNKYKAFHWLDHLEVAASTMSHHRMSLRMMNHLGVSQMVMVARSAKDNHFVARLKGCSLPVVLCSVGRGKYSVIGEVVEIEGWVASDDDDDDDEYDLDSDGYVGKRLCVNNLSWGAGYTLGSGRAVGGDWRHVGRARWVTMYLV